MEYGILCRVLELTCQKLNKKEPRISAFHFILEGMSLTKCKHLYWKCLHLSYPRSIQWRRWTFWAEYS